MVKRVLAVFGIIVALALVVVGMLIPARFQAVEEVLLGQAAQEAGTLTEQTEVYLRRGQTGPAAMLIDAAEAIDLDLSDLSGELNSLLNENPIYAYSGGPSPYFDAFLASLPSLPQTTSKSVSLAELLASSDSRERLEAFLTASSDPTVRRLLETRTLSGWQKLYPVDTPGGAALDIAVLSTALLVQSDAFSDRGLSHLENFVQGSLEGRISSLRQLERTYLSLLAAVGRFNWLTLEKWVSASPSITELNRISPWIREFQPISILFAATVLTNEPAKIASLLESYPDSAEGDLAKAVASGQSGLALLLEGPMPIYKKAQWMSFLPQIPQELARFAFNYPNIARGAVVLCWFIAGFLLAISLKALLWGRARVHERPLIEVTQDTILAGCLLLALIVLMEPDLLSQEVTEPGKLFLEFELGTQSATVTDTPMDLSSIDQITLIILLIFLVVQLIIYTGCLVKLGQIKRAPVTADIKIKLLENEDNLFDAGLYVGLAGTVISLLMLALGVVQASLVAAYASTLFGIIFVAALKIFHVRPLRRKFILEAGRF